MVFINNPYWILTDLFRKMKMILDEMCDNYAPEYDQYAQVQIAYKLIIDTLKEYISNP